MICRACVLFLSRTAGPPPGLAMLTKGLEDAKAEASRDKGGLGGLGNMFGAPDVLSKIASNPQTAPYLSDPSFMMKLQMLQQQWLVRGV